MLLPVELIELILKFVDRKDLVIPFNKYLSCNTKKFLYRNTTIEEESKYSRVMTVKYMLDLEFSANWLVISTYKLNEQFIREFGHKLDWHYTSEIPMSEDCIRNFIKWVNWYKISKYQKLSNNFIIEFAERLDLNIIFEYQKLSNNFLEQLLGRRNRRNRITERQMTIICKYQKLDESLIRKYANILDWHSVSEFQDLSHEFVISFFSRLDWKKLKI